MSTRIDATLDPQIVALLQAVADERERADLWQEVLDWAGGFRSRTGQPATLADLYREAPVLGLIEADDDPSDA
ncbi:MAG: hypothetical protein KDE20_17845 [Caldilineaceae bacterium]|nr:hypothetical protein [Caldilineaceae bacterium]MCB9158888.1 hypothetical protein [Caldilineaceae bacterium]